MYKCVYILFIQMHHTKNSLLMNHVLRLAIEFTVDSSSDAPLSFHFPKPGEREEALSTSITHDIIRSESYLAQSAEATLVLVKVIVRSRKSEVG